MKALIILLSCILYFCPALAGEMQAQKSLQRGLYEIIKGKDCKNKFSVPEIPCVPCEKEKRNLDESKQSAQIIETLRPRIVEERREYEKKFFGNVIDQQVSNARCAQNFLSALDQRALIPFDSGLTHITDDPCTNKKSPAYLAQKDILENKIYPYMRAFHEAAKKLRKAEQKYKNAKDIRNDLNPDNYDYKTDEDYKTSEFAAYNDLVKKKVALESIQSKIWNGTNSHVLEFIENHYKDGRPKEQFAKYFGDCDNRESFQTDILQAMQKENKNIITRDSSALEEFKGKKVGWSLGRTLGISDDPLESAKNQLVHSGVALTYLTSQEKKVDEFKDFSCYLEGSYGEGRDYVVDTRQGALAVGATILTMGDDLPWLVGGLVVTAGLESLELADSCSTDSEIGGAVNADVCSQVREYNQKKNKNSDEVVRIINSDVQARAGCFGTLADTALNLIPAVAEFKMGLKAKEIIKAGQELKEGDTAVSEVEGISEIAAPAPVKPEIPEPLVSNNTVLTPSENLKQIKSKKVNIKSEVSNSSPAKLGTREQRIAEYKAKAQQEKPEKLNSQKPTKAFPPPPKAASPEMARVPTKTTVIILPKTLEKNLRTEVPPQVVRKFEAWQQSVQEKGIEEVRKVPGLHDEPLLDPEYKANNCRSVRLSLSFRLIYCDGPRGSLQVRGIIPHY